MVAGTVAPFSRSRTSLRRRADTIEVHDRISLYNAFRCCDAVFALLVPGIHRRRPGARPGTEHTRTRPARGSPKDLHEIPSALLTSDKPSTTGDLPGVAGPRPPSRLLPRTARSRERETPLPRTARTRADPAPRLRCQQPSRKYVRPAVNSYESAMLKFDSKVCRAISGIGQEPQLDPGASHRRLPDSHPPAQPDPPFTK